MTDRRGTYQRCETYRCKKKAVHHGLCTVHAATRLEKMMEQNPSLTELVDGIVTMKLHELGLLE